MITLFVIQSCADRKDPNPAFDSFGDLVDDFSYLSSIDEVNKAAKETDWYAVFYDNERIDEELMEGLKVFVDISDDDVLVLFKLSDENHAYKSPRFFRRHVTLREGSLLPAQAGLKFETVLNGWVLPHGED